jgi:hypothetical protein
VRLQIFKVMAMLNQGQMKGLEMAMLKQGKMTGWRGGEEKEAAGHDI